LPVGSESIISQITANRKALLKTITKANGYSFDIGTVEEQRLFPQPQSYPYCQIIKLPITPNLENNNTEDTTIDYIVAIYPQGNDDNSSIDEIAYTNRNIIADITKAWMTDRYCSRLAAGTHRQQYSEGEVVSDNSGNVFFVAWVHFQVQAFIDSSDPYKQ
jgi:hypothetical protein